VVDVGDDGDVADAGEVHGRRATFPPRFVIGAEARRVAGAEINGTSRVVSGPVRATVGRVPVLAACRQ
jgi:hypothetical protein